MSDATAAPIRPAGLISRDHITLFLVGVGLSIAQFVMIRDFVSVLFGEEVIIALVTAAFFVGLSAGYLLSLRVSRRVFEYAFMVSAFLHLTFPFSYRYLAAWFAKLGFGGYAYLLLLFGYAVLFTAVFAAFLPRLVTLNEADGDPEARLRIYYSLELLGFVSGFFVVVATWNHPITYILPVYWVILAALLQLVTRRRVITGVFVATGLVAGLFLHQTDINSSSLLYTYKHYIPGAKVRFSINSPYQKVEVVDDKYDKRFLYLNGLMNLNTTDLEALNHYLAWVPAALIHPHHTLLVGNGTLSSVPKVYPFSDRVTSVELDPGVLEAGYRFFVPPNEVDDLKHWDLHVDDGKHFLYNSKDKYDLIIMDIPAPLTIQVAALHTVEFYRLARSHMTKSGVIAVQLSGILEPNNNRTPAQVTKALRTVFKQVMVLYSPRADRGFAYASDKLPFTVDQVFQISRAYEPNLKILHPDNVDSFLHDATALSVDNLYLVLHRGLQRVTERYFHHD